MVSRKKFKNLHHISRGGSWTPPLSFMSRNYGVSLLDFLVAPTGTCNLSMYTMYKLALQQHPSQPASVFLVHTLSVRLRVLHTRKQLSLAQLSPVTKLPRDRWLKLLLSQQVGLSDQIVFRSKHGLDGGDLDRSYCIAVDK